MTAGLTRFDLPLSISTMPSTELLRNETVASPLRGHRPNQPSTWLHPLHDGGCTHEYARKQATIDQQAIGKHVALSVRSGQVSCHKLTIGESAVGCKSGGGREYQHISRQK